MERFSSSKSGVRIENDFREHLIIDRYDPVFAGMRASKLKHLRSANSEDAVTWNVFRTLRQIAPMVWLPELFNTAFAPQTATRERDHVERATVELWQSVAPPPSLLIEGDEGESEIDVVIETPSLVWFIEAKLGSDISVRTTTRGNRDQVIRNIDVGSYYAGTRRFYFTLLIKQDDRSPDGLEAVKRYSDLAAVREQLAGHRPDGLANIAGVSTLRWFDVVDVLSDASEGASREDERQYAKRALDWLGDRGLASA